METKFANGDQPANPTEQSTEHFACPTTVYHTGMTKREAFTMAAMQGLCANQDLVAMVQSMPDTAIYRSVAKTAVAQADALLKELEK